MSTFISTVALMFVLSGFGFAAMDSSDPGNGPTTLNGTGINGAPICTNNLPNCGID
jgi:hypothetical protein